MKELIPVLETFAQSMQQLAEQTAQGQQQLLQAVEASAQASQDSVVQMTQALIEDRNRPRTVRTSSGRTIEINPAQMAQ